MTAVGSQAVTLKLKSDPRHLCLVRALVRSVAELAGLDAKQTHAVTLAVDEGCTNVIRHCYEGRSDRDLEVSAAIDEREGDGRWLVLRLRDFGPPISPETLKPSAEQDRLKPGGLGLRFMDEIMDAVELDTTVKRGNLLVLSLRCPSEPGRPSETPTEGSKGVAT